MALDFEIYGKTIQSKDIRYENVNLLESEDFGNFVDVSLFNELSSDLKTNYFSLSGGRVTGDLTVTGNINLSGNFNYATGRIDIFTPNVGLESNKVYNVDTTVAPVTGTLPQNPKIGDEIEFLDVRGKWDVNPFYVKSGNLLMEKNSSEELKCDIKYGNFKLNYVDPLNYGWKITTFTNTVTSTPPITISTLLSGLLAFWPLNENSGIRYDTSGNNRNLRDVNNNTGSSVGKVLSAVQFTGTSNKTLSSQTVFPLGNNKPFTLSFWINYTAFTNPGTRIITFNPTTQSNAEWGIIQNTTQFVAFNNFGVPVTPLDTTIPANLLVPNSWNFVTITKNSNYVWKYYKNGILLVTSNSNSGTWFTEDNTAIFIGQNLHGFTGDGPPNGLIDAVGIWNRVLTDQEILELYNNGNGKEIINI